MDNDSSDEANDYEQAALREMVRQAYVIKKILVIFRIITRETIVPGHVVEAHLEEAGHQDHHGEEDRVAEL